MTFGLKKDWSYSYYLMNHMGQQHEGTGIHELKTNPVFHLKAPHAISIHE